MAEPVASYKFFFVMKSGLSLGCAGRHDYQIVNRHSGEIIGGIDWYPRWRQYVFWSTASAVWSVGCLADVQAFIRDHAGKETLDG